jgi:hypothetical protein
VKKVKGQFFVPGGLYSFNQQGTNRFAAFAVVPEGGLNLTWRVTDFLALHAGYGAFYLNRALRPAAQIDRDISKKALPLFGGDPSKAPDPIREKVDSDFWAHGLNLGLDLDF